MPDNVTQDVQKWLIVVLIYADFKLQNEGEAKIDEDIKFGLDRMFRDFVLTALDPDRVRMIVIMSSNITSGEGHASSSKRKLLQFEIVNPSRKPINEIRRFNPGMDIEGLNTLQVAESLSTILKQITVGEEEEILLTTWDHGSAFGIFKENPVRKVEPFDVDLAKFPYLKLFLDLHEEPCSEQSADKPGDQNKLMRIGLNLFDVDVPEILELSNNNLTRLYNEHVIQINSDDLGNPEVSETLKNLGLSYLADHPYNPDNATRKIEIWFKNSQEPDILENHELQEALESWLGKEKKVGVLLMMNCYMMNMHTMYSMSKNAQCLVAPQGPMSNPGYNYKSILRYISRNHKKPISPKSLAKHCVDSSCNEHAEKRALRMGLSPSATIATWSIFAIDFTAPGDKENTTWFAQQIDTVAELLREIIKEYNDSGNEEGNSIRNLFNYSRSVMFDFGGDHYSMIDLLNWAHAFKRMDGNFFPNQLLKKDKYKDLSGLMQKLDHYINNDGRAASFISKNETKFFYNMSEGRYISPHPYGYSLFFPRKLSFAKNPGLTRLMQSDQLLKDKLPEWLKFIKEICDQPSDTPHSVIDKGVAETAH